LGDDGVKFAHLNLGTKSLLSDKIQKNGGKSKLTSGANLGRMSVFANGAKRDNFQWGMHNRPFTSTAWERVTH